MENITEKINEIITIADKCPELYKLECFKILLKHELIGFKDDQIMDSVSTSPVVEEVIEEKQREIQASDLHIKFKSFMDKKNISYENVNQLFYFENGSFLGMYDDLKTTKAAEVQIRIALLQAMLNAMNSGEFEFDGEAVRAECQKRKAYDSTNFTTNFKTKSNLFDKFNKYTKGVLIKLSEAGKDELSRIIEEISK